MTDLAGIIAAGAANPWAYVPVAVGLGALHALEPGHSKSLMAAFIIAVQGTKRQAVLLGLSAALGHTIVVWVIAAIGLALGSDLVEQQAEPWLVLGSGVLILGLSLRILVMFGAGGHVEGRDHPHDHPHDHSHDHVADAHAAAHARDFQSRFAGRRDLRAWDIAWFGFTGGLLPCPAAIAVLLVCLQLGNYTLGLGMVAAFSLGLALTMVSVGVAVAAGAGALRSKFAGLAAWGDRLPWISAGIVAVVGAIFVLRGVMMLSGSL